MEDLQSELSIRCEKIRKNCISFEDNPENKEEQWKAALNECASVLKDISNQAIFSENEEFSEIAAENIKYLLIPYYQANILQRFMINRLNILDLSIRFYKEFVRILENYGYFTKEAFV
jgi:hypothetical protein